MLALAVLLWDGSAVRIEAMSSPPEAPADHAPDFELKLMDGQTFRLSENLGKKVVVLNFFATWCGPCKKEMPELSAYYDKHRDKPFVMLGIDAGETEKKVAKFVTEYGVTFPVGIDKGDEIINLYGVRSLPTTVLIGADGTIKLFETGQITDAAKSFDQHLKESL